MLAFCPVDRSRVARVAARNELSQSGPSLTSSAFMQYG
jgi:hypothetical protein